MKPRTTQGEFRCPTPGCPGTAFVCTHTHRNHDAPVLHCRFASMHSHELEVVRPEASGDPAGCSCGGVCPDCNPQPYVVVPGCDSCAGSGCPDCMVEISA